MRIDGYIVADEGDKELYEWFGYKAVCPDDVQRWLDGENDGKVYINSYGGVVSAGSQIYTTLKSHGKIETIIDGVAASAASIVAMGGQWVKISPSAAIMIHNAATDEYGDYRDMEHAAEKLKTANQTLRNVYKEKTGLSDQQLMEYMDEEKWFDAVEAKRLRFVDDILFEKEIDTGILNSLINSSKRMYNSIRPPDIARMREMRAANQKPDNGLFLMQININNNRRNQSYDVRGN